MFICNIKVNGKLWFKIIMIIMGIIVVGVFAISVYKLLFDQNGLFRVTDEIKHSNITEIQPNDYTNILKAVHDDLDSYLGKEIKFSGYIYRVLDFSETQFVLARNMIIDSKYYVVGFLCEYSKIKDFEDGTWIEITGTITKGKYHNQDIPIIKIKELKEATRPENDFVLPPSNTYIPTSAML